MCTALTYQTDAFYFGRTLDYDFSYGETVTIMPRRFSLAFRHGGVLNEHYAVIGMAHVADGYPLYYDAVNEKGLGMAGLNFVGNAVYASHADGTSVAQYEFIPWVLSQYATVSEVKQALSVLTLTDTPFSCRYPVSQLHWIIADQTACITVESTKEGLAVYDNPVGVLTNNPPFPHQLHHYHTFDQLSNEDPPTPTVDDIAFSRGLGAVGLPGDLSSPSRFVRASFMRAHALSGNGEAESVSQFFHLLGTVEQVRGACKLGDDRYEITLYTSCCNAQSGVYYYTTYDNRRITAVDMHREDLDSTRLVSYPLIHHEDIKYQN